MLSPPGTSVLPRSPTPPIVILGAGGIVRDAHLPAYRLAGFQVAALYDLDEAKARALAEEFSVPRVAPTLSAAIGDAAPGTVFDLAVPAIALERILEVLPDGAPVLIQKPFGEDLEQARTLLALCRRKQLRAAVNFQLRYAPGIAAARKMIDEGKIGELHDIDIRITVETPWHLWKFLETAPRVEILYHSIHYIDLIRSFLGEPRGVYAKTIKHPKHERLASTRTTIILDYGEAVRANISVNHGHAFGVEHQESYVKWEGTRGAVKTQLGLLMNYPAGERDAVQLCTLKPNGTPNPWVDVPVEGSWYPNAFIETMASVMRFAAGESGVPPTGVEDAFKTMAVVEAAYISSAGGGTPIPSA